MNKEQEAKFEKWAKGMGMDGHFMTYHRVTWEAALYANGINTEEPVKDETTAAPEWVIDMMRTGKPVRCKVWDDCKEHASYEDITGYDLSSNYPFIGENQEWKHAEPIQAWQPQDGEAVLFDDDGRAMAGFILKGILYARRFMCADWKTHERVAPFNASKIGKPWSEI